ncbi:MAG: LysM peptidoglycan-binding domain-containing protein [Candidatus Eisenbacteria sp.]|nr:LysM peptidoglycan-binding domain-containing protein [Candidatus Eisenbacteria bacterium]
MPAMKHQLLCLVAVASALLGAGCSRSVSLREFPAGLAGSSVGEEDWGSSAMTEEHAPTAGDSLLAEDSDWLLDSLSVPIRPPTILEGLGADVPDISDSLAAATEAHLPSIDQLFDYPVELNRRVLTWIDVYQGKARKTFDRSLRRSGRYQAMARRIFREEGVPQDLVFLAHVESGFRHNARSPARALGLWQFMRGTARIYGVRCDAYVDERLDPEISTRAAARHLHDLYEEYGDWCLALAAYNAGSGKVNRAIRRSGTRDFWRIARTRHLRNETRNFVPAIFAVTILAKSPGAYGFTEETDLPLAYETVAVDSPTDLRVVARCSGATLNELQRLNPALLLLQTPPAANHYDVRVPVGLGETFARRIAEIPPDERLVYHRHVVHRGETLGLLARRYGTTVRAIQDANRMGRRTLIRIRQKLLIPSSHSDAPGLYAWNGKDSVRHIIARGETLSEIARHYGVRVRDVQAANGITNPHRIRLGQSLVIPVPASRQAEQTAEAAPPPPSEPAPAARAGAADQQAVATASRMIEQNTSDSLGRVTSTAHIVEQARQELLQTEALAEAEAEARPQPRHHQVRRGDTLSQIATRHGVRLSDLRRWNGLGSSSLIRPGQELLIAEPGGDLASGEPTHVHVVRRGESLWLIAQRYGVRTRDLADWNGIGRVGRIYPGQKIRVY